MLSLLPAPLRGALTGLLLALSTLDPKKRDSIVQRELF